MNPSLPGGPASAVTATGPTHAVVREVGLRDGLQSIARVLPTAQKIEWVNAAYAAGQREIEVGSFVPARLLPQLADTAEVLAHAQTLPGLRASVLVPNLKGAERALECGAHLMVVPLSASHAHSLANLRKTPDEVVAEVARIRAARDAAGSATLIEGGVGTAFGCTLQGEVAESEVLRLMQALLDAGADRVSLADTVGFADPASVQRLFAKARTLVGERLATVMGGSSGVLMSIFFTAAGQKLHDGQPLPEALLSGLAQMKQYGGADLGDRTLIDALQPALEALQKGDLQAAARAAQQGADATAKMVKAGAGRSSYVNKDNLDGVMDPGAVAVAEVFKAMAEAKR